MEGKRPDITAYGDYRSEKRDVVPILALAESFVLLLALGASWETWGGLS